MKREQAPDFKKVLSAEGESLPKSWDWFKDADVLKSFTDACLEVVENKDFLKQHPDKDVSVLGIGSGTAIVEQSVKEDLEEHGYNAKVIASDILGKVIQEASKKEKLSYVQMDNKSMPFDDASLDLVVARSVLQYEADVHDKARVMAEIYRVLKPGGSFIDQTPVFFSREEARLIADIYELLPKALSIETKDEAEKLRGQFFKEVRPAGAQARPLLLDKKMLFKRYDLNGVKQEQLITQSMKLIDACPEEKRPNLSASADHNDFSLRIPFVTYICKK